MEIGLFNNGLYDVWGVLGDKNLYGIVIKTPNSVYEFGECIKSSKYHLETDETPQWYLKKKQNIHQQ